MAYWPSSSHCCLAPAVIDQGQMTVGSVASILVGSVKIFRIVVTITDEIF